MCVQPIAIQKNVKNWTSELLRPYHYSSMLFGMRSQEKKYVQELIAVLAKIGASDKKLLEEFLIDLLTPAEYREIGLRWQIVKMLHKGMPQRQIAEKLGVSVATVGRGSRELLDPKGGFSKVLLLLKK